MDISIKGGHLSQNVSFAITLPSSYPDSFNIAFYCIFVKFFSSGYWQWVLVDWKETGMNNISVSFLQTILFLLIFL